jgi:hypothetical protein
VSDGTESKKNILHYHIENDPDLSRFPSDFPESLNDSDVVFHYTKLSTAIEKILFEGRLRISPKIATGDPFEWWMKDLPSIGFWFDKEGMERDLRLSSEVISPITKSINGTHVVSFCKHGEPSGAEKERSDDQCGYLRAKEILIRHAASLGWIKIRHYLNPSDFWSIQADNTLKRAEQIINFILWAVDEGILESHSEAVIVGYDNPGDNYRYRRKNGGVERYLAENLK